MSSDKPEEDSFERKKKKDYEYETLFEKRETGSTNDTRLRQNYQASQAYRSVSTSGSRTSLDADTAEVQSNVSLGGKSKTGSQLEVKSKAEKSKKKTKKGGSFKEAFKRSYKWPVTCTARACKQLASNRIVLSFSFK